jgi:hypothetical protein
MPGVTGSSPVSSTIECAQPEGLQSPSGYVHCGCREPEDAVRRSSSSAACSGGITPAEPDSGASYPDPVRDRARGPERCSRSAVYEGTLADSTRPILGYRPSRTLLN